jgi:hypothetical protein
VSAGWGRRSLDLDSDLWWVWQEVKLGFKIDCDGGWKVVERPIRT